MEKIMDSVRDFTINQRREVSAAEAAKAAVAGAVSAVKTFFAFLLYAAEYAISGVYRALKSEKAAYILGRYKKVVLGVSAGFVLFVIVGIVGGMEAGFISLAIGAPVAVGLSFVFKFLSDN